MLFRSNLAAVAIEAEPYAARRPDRVDRARCRHRRVRVPEVLPVEVEKVSAHADVSSPCSTQVAVQEIGETWTFIRRPHWVQ